MSSKLAFCADEAHVYVAFRGDQEERLTQVPLQGELSSVLPLAVEACLLGEVPSLIVVPRGPGSFTSLRIVLAFAYGLGQTKTVSTFDMLAKGANLSTGYVAIDSKRRTFFTKFFEQGQGQIEDEKTLAQLDPKILCVSSSPLIPFAHFPKMNWAQILLAMPSQKMLAPEYAYTPLYRKLGETKT